MQNNIITSNSDCEDEKDFENNATLTGNTLALSHTPIYVYSLTVNGIQWASPRDYTISGNVIYFNSSLNSDFVLIKYKYKI
jgi:hypothetical protein